MHCAVRVAANDDVRHERRVRSCARSPLSLDRLGVPYWRGRGVAEAPVRLTVGRRGRTSAAIKPQRQERPWVLLLARPGIAHPERHASAHPPLDAAVAALTHRGSIEPGPAAEKRKASARAGRPSPRVMRYKRA